MQLFASEASPKSVNLISASPLSDNILTKEESDRENLQNHPLTSVYH